MDHLTELAIDRSITFLSYFLNYESCKVVAARGFLIMVFQWLSPYYSQIWFRFKPPGAILLYLLPSGGVYV